MRSSSPASRGSARRCSGRRGSITRSGRLVSFSCTEASRPRPRSPSPRFPIWSPLSSTRWQLRWRRCDAARSRSRFCWPSREWRRPNHRAIGLALLDVLRALAERGPVLVALDDLQWIDSSSAGVLQIAFRRLGDEPVSLLATVRRAPEVTSPLELETSFPNDRLTHLVLGPLSLGALHHLLKDRAGLDLTRPELTRVQDASAGNPFFALELGRELVRTGTRPEAGRALRVPESLHELLDGRLARLPTETGDVVLFAAALARPTVELVAAAHGGRADVLEALDSAAREGVIELDDSSLRFAHPLLASICYEQAKPWKRRAVHGALARTVADLEERARHMALSVEGPDAFAASQLDAAAEQAAARGATAAAAELCEMAAQLTPDDPGLAHRRRIRSAGLYRLAGERERTVAMLEELLREIPQGVERADVLLELARTHRAHQPATIALLDDALTEAEADDGRSARILALSSPLSPDRCRDPRGHRRRPCVARKGRAGRRSRSPRGDHRPGGASRAVRRRDHSGPARAGRGDRGAARPSARVRRKPTGVPRPAPHASGRPRPSASDLPRARGQGDSAWRRGVEDADRSGNSPRWSGSPVAGRGHSSTPPRRTSSASRRSSSTGRVGPGGSTPCSRSTSAWSRRHGGRPKPAASLPRHTRWSSSRCSRSGRSAVSSWSSETSQPRENAFVSCRGVYSRAD